MCLERESKQQAGGSWRGSASCFLLSHFLTTLLPYPRTLDFPLSHRLHYSSKIIGRCVRQGCVIPATLCGRSVCLVRQQCELTVVPFWMRSIQALLSAPNPDDPLAENVARHWKDNEAEAVATGAPPALARRARTVPDIQGKQARAALLLHLHPNLAPTKNATCHWDDVEQIWRVTAPVSRPHLSSEPQRRGHQHRQVWRACRTHMMRTCPARVLTLSRPRSLTEPALNPFTTTQSLSCFLRAAKPHEVLWKLPAVAQERVSSCRSIASLEGVPPSRHQSRGCMRLRCSCASWRHCFQPWRDEREIVWQLSACVRGEQPRSGRGCTPRWTLRVGLRPWADAGTCPATLAGTTNLDAHVRPGGPLGQPSTQGWARTYCHMPWGGLGPRCAAPCSGAQI